MSLESSTTISGLVASNPAGTDSQSQGYQHLQLIKSVLKLQFPGVAGQGFAIPITAKETELNFLVGVTSAIQTQLNALDSRITSGQFPAGTRMVFAQATAPAGWTQVHTWANHMLRVVSTNGGGSGGSMSPIINNTVPTHTHPFTTTTNSVNHTHTLTMNPVPDHSHSMTASFDGLDQHTVSYAAVTNQTQIATQPAGGHTPSGTIGNQSVPHTHSGPTLANTGAVNWTPFYLDTIVCSKN